MTQTNNFDELPDRRRSSPVQVTKHQLPKWEHYEEDIERVWVEKTAERMKEILLKDRRDWFYLNYLFTLSAPRFTKEFNAMARKCQGFWYRELDNGLGRKTRRRDERNSDYNTRQFAYTGLLIIDGNRVPPHEWTRMEKQLKANKLIED